MSIKILFPFICLTAMCFSIPNNNVESRFDDVAKVADVIAPSLMAANPYEAGDLETEKAAAKIEISNYRGGAKKFTMEKTRYDVAYDFAIALIDAASSKASIDATVDTFKGIVDDIKDDDTLKNDAINEIDNYVSKLDLNKYSDENQFQIALLINGAKSRIANAKTKDELTNIVNITLKSIDEIPQIISSNNGCGGNVINANIILFILSLFGLALLICKKKKKGQER